MASAGGLWLPWIFLHGPDTGLKVLFRPFFAIFRSFFRLPPSPQKRLNSAIFQYLLLIFGLFFRCPPGKISADALALMHLIFC